MTKKINLLFLKNLIESDFLILNDTSSHLLTYLKTKSLTNSSLDIFQLSKTLKQFIRILQFLHKRKKKNLYFLLSNYVQLRLFKTAFKTSNFEYPLQLNTSFKNEKFRKISSSKAIFFLDKSLSKNKNLFNSLVLDNVFLIGSVNSHFEKFGWGTYKVHNDLIDFKKILFLSLVISKILGVQTNSKLTSTKSHK